MTGQIDLVEQAARDWHDEADRLLREFVQGRQCAPFLVEDFRRWSLSRLRTPRDARVYSAVVQRAARAGVIQRDGYAPAASSNRAVKTVWKGINK